MARPRKSRNRPVEPQPGEEKKTDQIQGATPPEATNHDHPNPPGLYGGAVGEGIVRAGHEQSASAVGGGPMFGEHAREAGTTYSRPAAVPSEGGEGVVSRDRQSATESPSAGGTAPLSAGSAPQPAPITDPAAAPSANVWTGASERAAGSSADADLGAAGGGASGPGNAEPNFLGANSGGAVAGPGSGGVTSISAAEIRHAKRREQHGHAGHVGRDRPQFAHDVMTPNVEVCTPETELYYIARMMADRNVGSIPVVENTDSMRLVGIVTDRDIVVRIIAKRQDPGLLKAFDCMSTNMVTIRPDASIADCLRLMEEKQIRRVPVVDADGRCIGIVAQADLAEMVPQQQAGELIREISEPGQARQGVYH